VKRVVAVCPSCGDRFLWETPRSWWLFQDRCYVCPDPERINDLPFPWEIGQEDLDAVGGNRQTQMAL
jgi:hypothetical protein